jgi:SAM-dependent methyltransferase
MLMGTLADDKFKKDISWEEKAKINPLFAVMSSEDFVNVGAEKWTDEDLEKFFTKGQFLFDVFINPILKRLQLNKKEAFIVEYGSGMGRILKAINAAGYNCAGIDISPTMLKYSRMLVPEATNLVCIDEQGNCDIPSDSADFVYSYAVIQHIQKLSLVKKSLSEICRILKLGGYLKFQYRSIQDEVPFKRLKIGTYGTLQNYEDYSLLVGENGSKRMDHNNWLGVPLSFKNMEKILNDFNVDLIGIEQDVGKKGNMIWVLGKK